MSAVLGGDVGEASDYLKYVMRYRLHRTAEWHGERNENYKSIAILRRNVLVDGRPPFYPF